MPTTVPQRPVSVLVLAILLIVFGGIGLLGSFCGGGLMILVFTVFPEFVRNNPPLAQNPGIQAQIQLIEGVPHFVPVTITVVVLSAVVEIGQIISGIGLLGMRPWARLLAIVVCGMSIGIVIASTLYQTFIVIPEQARLLGLNAAPGSHMGDWAGTFASLPSVVFAIVTIVMLARPSIRDAFVGIPPMRDEPRDWDGPRDRPEPPPPAGPPSTGIREL